MNGHRLRDFSDWIQQQGGEAKIFSMHGVDVNFQVDELHNMELAVEVYPAVCSRGGEGEGRGRIADRHRVDVHRVGADIGERVG